MAYDFIHATISGITGVTTVGQAMSHPTRTTGVQLPSATHTGITGLLHFSSVQVGTRMGDSASFTSSFGTGGGAYSNVYVVNGLIVSASGD